MGDFFVDLFWWALYALPVVVVVGIGVLIWRASTRRRSDERRELEQLRAQVTTRQDRPGATPDPS